MMTRDRFMGVNSIKFNRRFPDEDSCYAYLSEIKWEKGYVCKKCGNEHYCKGRLPYSRRCTRCKYDESSTVGTMFEKLKFSIHLAFHIGFKISTKMKEMSSFKPFFDEHICKSAKIVTNKWTGYLPLRNDYKNIEQTKSDEGKSAPDIHLHIMNIKGWLRGIHHHCSEEWLQGYLDEYHLRFNRRNNPEVLFDTLLKRMVEYKLMRTNTVN